MNTLKHHNKTSLAVGSLFAFRMLGLFMLIPVFTVYADDLRGSTHTLVGIAFGIYGLSQALLQIPFGYFSDRFGRKPVITVGFIMFALGSLMGVLAHNIWTMILARTLQGAGAVGSSLIALLSDLTDDDKRTKAMAMIGMIIGLSFSIAMVLGPLVARYFGVQGIFFIIFCLALLGITMLHTVIPTPAKEVFHSDSEARPSLILKTLKNLDLLRLDIGIFFQHAIFTAMFYAIPLILEGQLRHQWLFYLPIVVLSFLAAVPLIIISEKKKKLKTVFLAAIAMLFLVQLLLMFFHLSLPYLSSLLFLFFVAFNVLEASLPSLVSKQAPLGSKGTAMGIYSTSQFLGIFIGGTTAGVLYHHFGAHAIFTACSVAAITWLLIATFMNDPNYLKTFVVPVDVNSREACRQKEANLRQHRGVVEAIISYSEKVAYIKADARENIDTEQLSRLINA